MLFDAFSVLHPKAAKQSGGDWVKKDGVNPRGISFIFLISSMYVVILGEQVHIVYVVLFIICAITLCVFMFRVVSSSLMMTIILYP